MGSINLSAFVRDPFSEHSSFDFDGLKACVKASVKALNEVLDEGLPLHPLEEQRESVRQWRRSVWGLWDWQML